MLSVDFNENINATHSYATKITYGYLYIVICNVYDKQEIKEKIRC